jgi:hypothetical protein
MNNPWQTLHVFPFPSYTRKQYSPESTVSFAASFARFLFPCTHENILSPESTERRSRQWSYGPTSGYKHVHDASPPFPGAHAPQQPITMIVASSPRPILRSSRGSANPMTQSRSKHSFGNAQASRLTKSRGPDPSTLLCAVLPRVPCLLTCSLPSGCRDVHSGVAGGRGVCRLDRRFLFDGLGKIPLAWSGSRLVNPRLFGVWFRPRVLSWAFDISMGILFCVVYVRRREVGYSCLSPFVMSLYFIQSTTLSVRVLGTCP